MNGQIQIFNSPQFGAIRTAGTAEEPMFCLADVCKALGLTPKGVNQRLEKGVISNYPLETAGGIQQALFVNEDGLYDVILDSRKPEARLFRKWVTSEVLPSIRKSGGYIATSEGMSDEEIMAKALLVAQTAIKRKEEQVKALQAKTDEQQAVITQLKKSDDYLNEILNSPTALTITQIAQDYGMSAVTFNKRLADMKIQRKCNGQWILYAPHLGKGYIKSETIHFYHSDGRPDTRMVTKWTQRGRLFLYDALKEVAILPTCERA